KNESQQLSLPIEFFTEILQNGSSTFKKGNTFFSGIKYNSKSGQYVVIVAANNYYDSHHLRYLRNVLLIAIPLAAILTLMISILFSKRVFNPVKQITDKVKEISSENMHMR